MGTPEISEELNLVKRYRSKNFRISFWVNLPKRVWKDVLYRARVTFFGEYSVNLLICLNFSVKSSLISSTISIKAANIKSLQSSFDVCTIWRIENMVSLMDNVLIVYHSLTITHSLTSLDFIVYLEMLVSSLAPTLF